VQQNALYNLEFCGFGALSDCDCAASSFDPQHFTVTPAPALLTTSLLFSKTDGVKTIELNSLLQLPDTVSSVCGNRDGLSKCGPRLITVTDKNSGLPVTESQGISFSGTTLTIDTAQAITTRVLTVSLSLVSNPQVFWLQEITLTFLNSDNCTSKDIKFVVLGNEENSITATQFIDQPVKISVPLVTDSYS